jgi:hypothetical protein
VRRGIEVAFGFSKGHSPGRARVTIEQSFPHASGTSPERWRTLVSRHLTAWYLPLGGAISTKRPHATWQRVHFPIETVLHTKHRLLTTRTHTKSDSTSNIVRGLRSAWLVKRKMGVFARSVLTKFGILRIRRLRVSAEGELVEANLSSTFKKHKTKLNAKCKNPLTKLVQKSAAIVHSNCWRKAEPQYNESTLFLTSKRTDTTRHDAPRASRQAWSRHLKSYRG